MEHPGSMPGKKMPEFGRYTELHRIYDIELAINELGGSFRIEAMQTPSVTIFEFYRAGELNGAASIPIDRIEGPLLLHGLSPLNRLLMTGIQVPGIEVSPGIPEPGEYNPSGQEKIFEHFKGIY